MKCPKCNKEMKVMCKSKPPNQITDAYTIEVVGRCDCCDIDAKWEETHVVDSVIIEHNFQRYYFG